MVSTHAVRRRRAVATYGFVAAVGACALVGIVLAGTVSPMPADRAAVARALSTRHDDLGHELPTSFGVVAATSVRQTRGLTSKELAGVTHFPSYVPPNRMQVRVSVQLSNVLDRPVRYSARQFALRVGGGPPIAPSRSGIPFGTLQPDAALEQTLSFVVPRTQRRGVRLTLEFRESGLQAPVVVRLGTARPAAAPPPAAKPDHTGHARSPP